jgi:hypothetical protein
MRTVLLLGHTDLRLFLREKTSYIWLFAIPLAFTYFMGFRGARSWRSVQSDRQCAD